MDRFTNKIGPLPAWAWGLGIVLVAYLGYHFYSQSAGAAAVAPVTDPTSDSAAVADTGVDTTDAASYAADPQDDGSSDAGAVSGSQIVRPGQFTDDNEWSAYVAMHLQSTGADPVTVSNALNNYLSGTPLTVAQAALIRIATIAYGYPPGGVYPITVANAPAAPGHAPITTPGGTTHPAPTKPVAAKPVSGPAKAPATPGGFALHVQGTTITATFKPNESASYVLANAAGQVAGTSHTSPIVVNARTPGRTYSYKLKCVSDRGKSSRWTALHVAHVPAKGK